MNRRNFFKTVTGFIAGVFVPGVVKADEEYHPIFSPLIKRTKELLSERGISIPPIQKSSGTRLVTEKEKAEYCVSKPFCKGCLFGERQCLLPEVSYKILWEAFEKV